jgi:hypothetical protein
MREDRTDNEPLERLARDIVREIAREERDLIELNAEQLVQRIEQLLKSLERLAREIARGIAREERDLTELTPEQFAQWVQQLSQLTPEQFAQWVQQLSQLTPEKLAQQVQQLLKSLERLAREIDRGIAKAESRDLTELTPEQLTQRVQQLLKMYNERSESFERLESLTLYMSDCRTNNTKDDWILYKFIQAIYRFPEPEQLTRQTNLLIRFLYPKLIKPIKRIKQDKQGFSEKIAAKAKAYLRKKNLNLNEQQLEELIGSVLQQTGTFLGKNLVRFDMRKFSPQNSQYQPPKRLMEALERWLAKRTYGSLLDELEKRDDALSLDSCLGDDDERTLLDIIPDTVNRENWSDTPEAFDVDTVISLLDIGANNNHDNPEISVQDLISNVLAVCYEEIHERFTEYCQVLSEYPQFNLRDITEWVLLKYFYDKRVEDCKEKAAQYNIKPTVMYNILYDRVMPVVLDKAIFNQILIPSNYNRSKVALIKRVIEADSQTLKTIHPKKYPSCDVDFLRQRLLPMFRPKPDYTPLSFTEIAIELQQEFDCRIEPDRIRDFWYSRPVTRHFLKLVVDNWDNPNNYQDVLPTLQKYINSDPQERLKSCCMLRRSEVHAQFLALNILYEHRNLEEIYDLLYCNYRKRYPRYRLSRRREIITRIGKFWHEKAWILIQDIAEENNYQLPELPKGY